MTTETTQIPRSLVWERLDGAGTGLAVVERHPSFRACGTVVAAAPLPHVLHYQLSTQRDWSTRQADLRAEGAGWTRRVTLRRDDRGWHVSTEETGDLDRALAALGHAGTSLPGIDDPDRLTDALDAQVATVPLTLTPAIHRTGILDAGQPVEVTVAYVLVPSLTVVARTQRLSTVAPHTVLLESGNFCAAVDLDQDGLVTEYPGLARRLEHA